LLYGVQNKRPVTLSPVSLYSSYISWLEGLDKDSSLSYWSNYLSGYDSKSSLPFVNNRLEGDYSQKKEHLLLEGDLLRSMQLLCRELSITENSFIQGVWGYLLSRYNNTRDVVFGAVVSGRPDAIPGIEDMVGLFINTIPVRIQYTEVSTAKDLLEEIQQGSIASLPHHYLNLSEVQSQSPLGMDLLDHIMVFENYAVKELDVLPSEEEDHSSFEDSSVVSREVYEQTNYNFTILVVPFKDQQLRVEFVYDQGCFEQEEILRMKAHFMNVLRSFVSAPDSILDSIDYLDDKEREELLDVFNATEVAYPKGKTVVDLFESQVLKRPEAIAVVYEDERLSYGELNRRSNQLGHYLKELYNIEPDDLVGIKLPHSSWMIVGILGVLKSGGAYVPIEREISEDRTVYIQENSNLLVLIDEAFLEKFNKHRSKYSIDNLSIGLLPSNLVYVIYTSGSTGKPKGVEISHNSLINYNHWLTNTYDIGNNDSSLISSSISFDLILTSIYGCILNGGTLHLLDKFRLKDPLSVIEYIESTSISYLKVTPTYLNLLLQGDENNSLLKIKTLRLIFTGGERANISDIAKIIEGSSIRLVNHYGPTESTIGSCVYDITNTNLDDFLNRPRIGAPISNTEIYILNREGLLQPIGVTGELYIGGAGLARGYLNNEELTAERFVSNPFKEGTRMYKTGDLGRWNSDGTITFLGREDAQVKIRGYRIELGEIESVLLDHSEIDQAVVLANDNDGVKELVAYFVSSLDHDSASLRSYLKGFLPDYMLPSYYVALDVFPLTPNGKIDRRSLPSPKGLEIGHGVVYVAPETDTEKQLVAIWEAVLGKDKIGIKDDFFELGGHSLNVMRMTAKIHQQFNLSLEVKRVFYNLNIENIALEIDNVKWLKKIKKEEVVKKIII
uniref:non-ribosomal peptide synthetase n=1 Tax=Gillisia sp. Hel_I_29 TaxID=1249975 RepID=UPI0012E0C1D3